jgi:sulfite exporter TauE/SafE
MTWSVIITGFTLGAAGSLHCVGMCGPLSLSLPVHHLSKPVKFLALLLYQLGRVITYSMIGLLFGLAGRSIYIAGYQQWFSIGMGVIILLLAALYFLNRKKIRIPFLNKFYQSVHQLIIKILKSPTRIVSFLLLGMGQWPIAMWYGLYRFSHHLYITIFSRKHSIYVGIWIGHTACHDVDWLCRYFYLIRK